MTKKIIKSIQFLTITSLLLGSLSLTSFARQPDVVTDKTDTPIPIDRSESISIYFPYGSVVSDLDIEDAVASVGLNGDDLEFVTAGFADWYYGNPNRPDSDANIPEQPACNSSYSGPKYQISPSLATSSSLKYGLQSARNTASPSGTSGPGVLELPDRTVNGLREKHTGCIKVEFRVSSTATVGSTTEVIFDQDAEESPTYQEDRRPARQIVRFQIAAAENPEEEPVDPVDPVDPVEEEEEDTTFEEELPRSGGGVAILGSLSIVAFSIVSFIIYKVRKKQISKIDLN
jgi:hypothetical protein